MQNIYVIFGKAGGLPGARWGRYEEIITHVRVANAPRFAIDLSGEQSALFDKLNLSYDNFIDLDQQEKMRVVREYTRRNLKSGGSMWWLDGSMKFPSEIRIFRTLSPAEKRQLRAEAALLCPEVVGPSTSRGKYDRASVFLITRHGVIASQIRDLFSAGSVGARSGKRGHKYITDSLGSIESEMRSAASYLGMDLFEEYWGFISPPELRIKHWLNLADNYATDWTPSRVLFLQK